MRMKYGKHFVCVHIGSHGPRYLANCGRNIGTQEKVQTPFRIRRLVAHVGAGGVSVRSLTAIVNRYLCMYGENWSSTSMETPNKRKAQLETKENDV